MIGMIIYTVILFVLLTPSILFSFPKKSNKWTVAFVHGLVFAIIFHFTHKFVHKENFKLYDDEDCTEVRVGPNKNKIPNEDSGDIYYKAVNKNNACVGANFAK